MAETLEKLLRACTVRICGPEPDATLGAGFFVAPGKVLTCQHVIHGVSWESLAIRWKQDGQESVVLRVTSQPRTLPGRGRPITALAADYPDIVVLEVDAPDGHLCVRLETGLPRRDDQFRAYGYPEEGGSVNLTPVALGYRGIHGHEPAAYLDMRLDTVKPGMSGAALLNWRTRDVCGVIVATKHPSRADGALAVACRAVADDLDDVLTANREFHKKNHSWRRAQDEAEDGAAFDSPYRGLESFRESDARFFFGREDAAVRIRNLMSDGRGLLVVSGASGAGKSSLLQAGVLPRLRKEGLKSAPEAASWPRLMLTPGRAPLSALALETALLTQTAAPVLQRELKDNPAGFALTARQAARAQTEPEKNTSTLDSAGGRLLLIVDQFEQLFTQCQDETERQAFITALHAAADGRDGTPAALVVLGLRADFETRCAEYPELTEAVQKRYLVTPMTGRQLQIAITGPAQEAGTPVDDELTRALLEEVEARQPGGGAGVLPLLSHALDQAWRFRAGHSLTLADYERTGGIEGAIAASAKRAYKRLTADQRTAAQQIFTRLVATSADGEDTAASATRAELTQGRDPAGIADVKAVLEAFVAERLLILTREGVQISHEALLREWPLLRDWLDETRAARTVRTRLRVTAAEWEKNARDPSYLYRGILLQAAAEAADRAASDPARNPPLNPSEREFLRDSQQVSRRSARRRRAAIAVLSVLVMVVGGLAIWANQQRETANQQRDQAIANQIMAEIESGQLSTANPSLTARLLDAAHRIDPGNQDLSERLLGTENQPLASSQHLGDDERGATSVAYSPNGRILALGAESVGGVSSGGKVTLWDVSNPARPKQLGGPLTIGNNSGVRSVEFSPDGRTLAVGGIGTAGGGGFALWDVSRPERPMRLGGSLMTGNNRGVTSVAFSPDGRTLAVGGIGTNSGIGDVGGGEVGLWDVSNPVRLKRIGGSLTDSDGESVEAMAFSPDGRSLAVGGYIGGNDGNAPVGDVALWDVSRPGRPMRLGRSLMTGNSNSSEDEVFSVAFSPDGRTLAVGLGGAVGGGEVGLWDVSNPVRLKRIGGSLTDSRSVDAVAFSPDGRTLAAGDDGGGVTRWNIADPAQPNRIGNSLVTGDRSGAISVAFTPDGSTLLVGNYDETITRWGLPAITAPASDSNFPGLQSEPVAFSPDGRTVAVGGGGHTVGLWDVSNARRPKRIGRPLPASDGGSVDMVAFSPDGRTLAVGGAGGVGGAGDNGPAEVDLWDVSDPARPMRLGGPLLSDDGGSVSSVAFSPDGRTLAIGGVGANYGSDAGVALWDVSRPLRPKELGSPLTTDLGGVSSVAFSPDGRTLAVGIYAVNPSFAGGVALWDVSRPLRPKRVGGFSMTGNSVGGVSSVVFSPDGRTLAVDGADDTRDIASGGVALWDVSRPGRPKRVGGSLMTSDNRGVSSMAFSPDSRTLAVSDSGAEVTLWDVANLGQPRTIGQPLTTDADSAVVFSLHRNVLAAYESDNTMQIWDMDVNYATSRICQLTSGALTSQQWHQYIPQLPYDPLCPEDR